MKNETVRLLAVLSVICLGSALPTLAGEDASDLAGRAAAWQAAFNAGDYPTVATQYSTDAHRMPPNAATLEGRDAILAQMQQMASMGVASIEIVVTEAKSSGDHAYGTGTYALSDSEGNELDRGKWMNVSVRSEAGWHIHRDIWNSDLPLSSE